MAELDFILITFYSFSNILNLDHLILSYYSKTDN